MVPLYKLQRLKAIRLASLLILVVSLVACGNDKDALESISHNVTGLQSTVDEILALQRVKDAPSGSVTRVSTELAEEFAEDEAFLDQVVVLKKQKLLAQLQYDISKLEDIASQSSPIVAEANGYSSSNTGKGNDFKVFMINFSAKAALVKLGDEVQRAFIGDQIGAYTVNEINSDHIVLELPSGETRIKRLTHNAGVSDLRIGGELLEKEQTESTASSFFNR